MQVPDRQPSSWPGISCPETFCPGLEHTVHLRGAIAILILIGSMDGAQEGVSQWSTEPPSLL